MVNKLFQKRPISDGKVHSLLAKLGSENWNKSSAAAEALRKIGDRRLVPLLISVCKDKSISSHRQYHAASAFGKIRDPQAVPALIAALDDKEIDSFTRRQIIHALIMIRDLRAVPALIQSLKDRDAEVRIKAAETLGTWKSSAAVPALIAAFKDKGDVTDYALGENGAKYYKATWYVCDEAVMALGKIGDMEAVPALTEAWRNEKNYGHTRDRAIGALGDIGGPLAVHSLIEALDSAEYRNKAVRTLAMIGPPAVSALMEAVRSANYRSVIIPALIKILESDKYLLPRCRAAELLKAIAVHQPDPALRAALPILLENHRWNNKRNSQPAFKEAMAQIEAVTANLKDLPLPASAPPLDARALPRPADAPPNGSPPSPPGWGTRLRRVLRGR